MDVFLVRRTLAGVSEADLQAALRRCHAEADALARIGHVITYLGSTYVPGDGFCGSVYRASSADVVRLATERAAVPYEEIVPALLLDEADRPADPITTNPRGEQ